MGSFPLHNTAIIRDGSEQLEINAYDSPLNECVDIIQPIVKIEPYISVLRTASAGTIYTTPTNNDFYLTNVVINGGSEAGGTGFVECTFTTADGRSQSIKLIIAADALTGAGNNSLSINFPMRGLKLARNSAVALAQGGTIDQSITIAGYEGSNRS